MGFSQARLANEVGVATSTICHIEAGTYTKFPLDKVLNLAQIYGVDRHQFAVMWIDAILENKRSVLKKKIFGLD